MTWVKLDDHFFMHPKVMAVGPAAAWLWVASIGYANANLTDGFIPVGALPMLAMTQHAKATELASKLVAARLWEKRGDEGFLIHDYRDWNPSAKEVRAKRQANADRVQKHRGRTKQTNDSPGNADVTRYESVGNANVTPPLLPHPPFSNPEEEIQTPIAPLPQPAAGSPPAEPAVVASGRKARKPKGQRLTPTADEQSVFDHWVTAMGKTGRTIFSDERIAPVRALLAAGFTVDDLKQAASGCAKDPFSMGKNDRNTAFNDLTVIYRDAPHVEKFMAVEERSRPRPMRIVPSIPEPVPSPLTPEQLEQLKAHVHSHKASNAAR